jgi:Cu-processing system permease protein
LLLNPADVFRVINVFGADALRSSFGLGTLMAQGWNAPATLYSVLLAWIVAPLGVALWRFR